MARDLASALANEELLQEVFTALPAPAQAALAQLSVNGGSMPWAQFVHQYGPLRPMGPARRDREKPHLFPASTTERLFYRSLISREFVSGSGDSAEVACLPHEFLSWAQLFSEATLPAEAPTLAPQAAPATEAVLPGGTILDEICTFFAAQRLDQSAELLKMSDVPPWHWPVLAHLLQDTGLWDGKSPTLADNARSFMTQPRSAALTWLTGAWASSASFDELRLIPGLRCEGTWRAAPLPPRRWFLNYIAALPDETWLRFDDLLNQIRKEHFYFLRQSGDFLSWMIRHNVPGSPLLLGEDYWDEVEGAWLRFVLLELLPWMGLVETAPGGPSGDLFLKHAWAGSTLMGDLPPGMPATDGTVSVSPVGEIRMEGPVPLLARYQLARFTEWQKSERQRFVGRITPASLKRASAQGLTVRHLTRLLRKYTTRAVAPVLVKALIRWENEGPEARLDSLTVLRLKTPDQLQMLRDSPAGRHLGEALGPATVIVKEGAAEKVRAELARLGLLCDSSVQGQL